VSKKPSVYVVSEGVPILIDWPLQIQHTLMVFLTHLQVLLH
jgi:hypothetical protein